jgi:hypothetical protein
MSKHDIKSKLLLYDSDHYADLLVLILGKSYDITCSVPFSEGGELVHFSYHKDGKNHFYIIYHPMKKCYEKPAGFPDTPLKDVTEPLRIVSWFCSGDMSPLKWNQLLDNSILENEYNCSLSLKDIKRYMPLAIDLWLVPKGMEPCAKILPKGYLYSKYEIIKEKIIKWNNHYIFLVIWPIRSESWKTADFSDRVASIIADSFHGIIVSYPGYRDKMIVEYERADYAFKKEDQWYVGASLAKNNHGKWVNPFVFVNTKGKVQYFIKNKINNTIKQGLLRINEK